MDLSRPQGDDLKRLIGQGQVPILVKTSEYLCPTCKQRPRVVADGVTPAAMKVRYNGIETYHCLTCYETYQNEKAIREILDHAPQLVKQPEGELPHGADTTDAG